MPRSARQFLYSEHLDDTYGFRSTRSLANLEFRLFLKLRILRVAHSLTGVFGSFDREVERMLLQDFCKMASMLLHRLWTKAERVAGTSLNYPFVDRFLGIDRREWPLTAGALMPKTIPSATSCCLRAIKALQF